MLFVNGLVFSDFHQNTFLLLLFIPRIAVVMFLLHYILLRAIGHIMSAVLEAGIKDRDK